MFDFMHDREKNIVIFIVLSLLMVVGLSYGRFYNAAAIFFPSAGVYTGFYYIYRKRVLPGIISAIFLTNMIYRTLTLDEELFITLILSVAFLISNLVEMVLFSYLIEKLKIKLTKTLNVTDLGKYAVMIILIGVVGSFIGVTALSLVYGFEEYNIVLITWAVGSSSGILVFSSLIINTHLHDHPISFDMRRFLYSITYILIFFFITLFIFVDFNNNYLSFDSFQIFLILLYLIAAAKFSYRMIAVSNVILILFVDFIYLPLYTESDLFLELIRLNLFIMIMSSIASVVRILILEREHNYEQMKMARNNMEKMILATNELFQIENKIPSEIKQSSLKYLRNMFQIATETYPNFDLASCHIKDGKYVVFVSAIGYDIKQLNDMKFLSEHFVWEYDKPAVVTETDYDTVFEEQTTKDDFFGDYTPIKQSIRFTVKFGEDELAGMSFDIIEGSEKSFQQQDLDNFVSFQSLMNSYYRVETLSTEKHRLKDDIVLSLVRTLELYDLYTGGHSEQVAELSALIGEEMKLPANQIRDLYWSGIVHDIGKIGLPEQVLNKNGKLTKEEYELVKKHSEYGYDILSKSQGLMDIALIVRHHHEWYNGKGYPDGLKGNEIPFLAQILHACDAVDAMAQDRIYRARRTEEEMMDQLAIGSGDQFNPDIARVLIDFIRDGKLKLFLENKNTK